MSFWESFLKEFQERVRNTLYPLNAENILKEGKREFRKKKSDARLNSFLEAHISLRICICCFDNPEEMKKIFYRLVERPEDFYLFDDLLHRLADAYHDLPDFPPPLSSDSRVESLRILNLYQYRAETLQMVALNF